MSASRRSFDLIRIGKGLIVLRNQRDMSQKQLSHESRVAQNTISRMEAGENYEVVNLLSVLEALDRKPADFFADLGMTDETETWQDYEMIVKFKARRLKSISGNVTGPGIMRAKSNE